MIVAIKGARVVIWSSRQSRFRNERDIGAVDRTACQVQGSGTRLREMSEQLRL